MRTILTGVIAGATGELVLNILTYGDMLVRARPASPAPAKVAKRASQKIGIELASPGEPQDRATNREEGIGALLGYGVAVGIAVTYQRVIAK